LHAPTTTNPFDFTDRYLGHFSAELQTLGGK
jgi:hypothetical protein